MRFEFHCDFHDDQRAIYKCMYDGYLLCNSCHEYCAEDGHPTTLISLLKEF